MTPGEWIALVTLFLIYGSAILTFWIRMKVEIKQLEIKIQNMEERLNNFTKSCNVITSSNKEDHKAIEDKMDLLLQAFNDFRVYVEQKFNGKD